MASCTDWRVKDLFFLGLKGLSWHYGHREKRRETRKNILSCEGCIIIVWRIWDFAESEWVVEAAEIPSTALDMIQVLIGNHPDEHPSRTQINIQRRYLIA